MIQSPPGKRRKLNLLTSATVVERDFHPRRRNQSRRRARSAPAVGRQPVGDEGEAPSTDDAGPVDDDLAGFQGDGADDHVEFERSTCLPHFPQQQSHRSETAQQNANAWDAVRDNVLDSYVRNLVLNAQLVSDRKLSLQSSVQRVISSAAGVCPSCDQLDQNLTFVKQVEVLWVGSHYRFIVSVPVHFCHCCNSTLAVNPLQAGCFPSTPVQAWDVSKTKQGERPVWFDLSLLKVRSTSPCMRAAYSMMCSSKPGTYANVLAPGGGLAALCDQAAVIRPLERSHNACS